MTAPIPARREHIRIHHGDEVIDPYEWLRDRDNPEVIAHLEAENAYTDAQLAHLAPLKETIFEEIKSHTLETDLSVPVRQGDFWYLRRSTEGQQYPTYSRVPVDGDAVPELVPGEVLPGEQLILDCAALAQGQEFFALGALTVSADQRRLGYSVDFSGDEYYDARIVDLETGELLDDSLRGIGSGLVLNHDGSCAYYRRFDDAWRPFQSWRHSVGSDPADDELLYQEDDQRFSMAQGESRNSSHLVIASGSPTATEFRLLDLSDPAAQPVLVTKRRPDFEYSVEVADDHLLIVHNANQVGFEVAQAPLGASEPQDWETVLASAPGERIEGVDFFDSAAVVSLRCGGLASVRVIPRGANGWDPSAAWDVTSGGELDTVVVGDNRMVDAPKLRYELTSLLIPATVCEVDFATREVTVLRETPVPGYDRSAYVERRVWVEADDGVKIPVSLVARAEVSADGTNPGYLYGYGAYEICEDPSFVV